MGKIEKEREHKRKTKIDPIRPPRRTSTRQNNTPSFFYLKPEKMEGVGMTFRDIYGLIPTFDGKNIPVDHFIGACKRAAKIIPATEHAQFLVTVQYKLTGFAQDLAETKNYTTLDEFYRDLKESFGATIELLDLELELKAISQNFNESVAEYATRTRIILKRITERLNECYSRADEQTYLNKRTEEVQKSVTRAFIRGLFDKIAVNLNQQNLRDFDVAVREAIHMEQELKHRQSVNHGRIAKEHSLIQPPETARIQFAETKNQHTDKFCELHQTRTHSTGNCYAIKELREKLEQNFRSQSPRDIRFDNRQSRHRSESRNPQQNDRPFGYRNNSRDRYQNNYRNQNYQNRFPQNNYRQRDYSNQNNYHRNNQNNQQNNYGNRDNFNQNNYRRNNQNNFRNRDNSQNRDRNSRWNDFYDRQPGSSRDNRDNSQNRYRDNSQNRFRDNSQSRFRENSNNRRPNGDKFEELHSKFEQLAKFVTDIAQKNSTATPRDSATGSTSQERTAPNH